PCRASPFPAGVAPESHGGRPHSSLASRRNPRDGSGMLSVRGLHPVAAGDRTRQCRQKRAPKCPGSVKGRQRHLPFTPTASCSQALAAVRGTAVTRLGLVGCTEADIASIARHSLRDERSILSARWRTRKLRSRKAQVISNHRFWIA